jgi:hypothetical protein
MFPPEIVDQALRHLGRKGIVKCRGTCRAWFQLADVILDRYRRRYILIIKSYMSDKRFFEQSSVMAMNMGEAVCSLVRTFAGFCKGQLSWEPEYEGEELDYLSQHPERYYKHYPLWSRSAFCLIVPCELHVRRVFRLKNHIPENPRGSWRPMRADQSRVLEYEK